MNKLIRLAALLAVVLMFFGCAPKNEAPVDFDYEESDETNFYGYNMRLYVNLDSTNSVATQDSVLGFVLNTGFADSVTARIAEIEKKYNSKFDISYFTNSFTDMFSAYHMSGDYFCDSVVSNSTETYKWAKEGYLTGLSSLTDYIDYRDAEKWGSPRMLESGFYNGEVYGVVPAAWPEQIYSSFGYPLVANLDLINSCGGNDPRELSENKKWDWEAFHKELDACTVDEGGTVKYGMVTTYPYMSQMIILSNGVQFSMLDEEGKPYCGYYTPEGMRGMEEVRKLWSGDMSYTVSKLNPYYSEKALEDFINEVGSYAFLPTHFILGVYGEVSMKLDNFAILQTPVGPDVEPDYIASVYHTQYYTISFSENSDDIQAAAFMINDLYEPLPGFETRDEIKAYMMENYFFDPRDAEVFYKLLDAAVYNYDYATDFKSRSIPETICTQETKTISSLLEKNETIIAELMETVVEPCLSTYEKCFPGYTDIR